MKLFLSWSGPRSKAVAETFASWFAKVIQALDPLISSDIDKGKRWAEEIAVHLEDAKVGIVCLTSSNLTAPWILFEAGALSKLKESHVCTFLLDHSSPADIEPPLGQFQHTTFQKSEVLKLVTTVNRMVEDCGERSLTDSNLLAAFETYWPQLEAELKKIKESREEAPIQRPEREILEEMLEILRGQEQRAEAKRRLEAAFRAIKGLKGRKIIGPKVRENIDDPLVQKALEVFESQTASENVIPPPTQHDSRAEE